MNYKVMENTTIWSPVFENGRLGKVGLCSSKSEKKETNGGESEAGEGGISSSGSLSNFASRHGRAAATPSCETTFLDILDGSLYSPFPSAARLL